MDIFLSERDESGFVSPSDISQQLWLIVSIVLMLGFISMLARLAEAKDLRTILEKLDPEQVNFLKDAAKESLLRAVAEAMRDVEDSESISMFSDFGDRRDTTDPDHPCHRVIVKHGLPNDKEAAKLFNFAKANLGDEKAFAILADRLLQAAIEKVPAVQQAAIKLDPTLGTHDPLQSVLLQGLNMIRDRGESWRENISKTEISLLERAISDLDVLATVINPDPIKLQRELARKFAEAGYPLLTGIVD